MMEADLSQSAGTSAGAANKITQYCLVGLGLLFLYQILRGSDWLGTLQLHTLMEVSAAILAIFVGALALTRFYSQKNSIFLFVGTGFLGTFFLDGYHALVTSEFFAPYLPSDLPSLIPWSWVASRQFLAIMLFLSWLVWRREKQPGPGRRISDRTVYRFSIILTVASFIFFAFFPLPRAYYPELLLHRPEEIAPALFFAIALIGYLRKGAWRLAVFEHWLIISLIVNLAAQLLYMPYSSQIFDLQFDMAHLLKIVSYACVLVGLIADMYLIFQVAGEQRDRLQVELGERRKIEAAAAHSAASLRLVFDTVLDGLITINAQGTVEAMNLSAQKMFGYDAEQAVGHNVTMLMPKDLARNHDDYVTNYRGSGASTVVGARRDLLGRRRDGTTFPIDLAVSEANLNGRRLFVGVMRDITDRKAAEAERERTQLELVRFGENAEKAAEELERSNADLEQFASVAAHDLQEPLRKVQAFGDRLQSKYADVLDEQGLGYISRMQGASGRMQQLITDLLAFSKVGRSEQHFGPVNLDQVAHAVISDLDVRVTETSATIEVSGLPAIDADPLQMRQLFQNIIGNALKYQRDGIAPVITIEAKSLVVGRQGIPICELTVTDNGIGFDEQYAERIFGIFQRLHGRSKYDGTGVGLAICRKIVERHNGTIVAEGRPGEGAAFVIRLPVAQPRLGVQAA